MTVPGSSRTDTKSDGVNISVKSTSESLKLEKKVEYSPDELLRHDDEEHLLNGHLEVRIINAQKLKGQRCGCGVCCLDNCSSRIGCCRLGGLANPVVEVFVGADCVIKTKNRINTLKPKWKEKFSVHLCHMAKRVVFRVSDLVGADNKQFLGQIQITAEDLLSQCSTRCGLQGKFPLGSKKNRNPDVYEFSSRWIETREWEKKNIKKNRKGPYGLGWLKLQVRFTPAQDELRILDKLTEKIRKDSGDNVTRTAVPGTYFNARYGGEFCLYQSAHQPGTGGGLPQVRLGDGSFYNAASCWFDISQAIKNAKYFICISAVSLNVHCRLVRAGPTAGTEPTIGELLKARAEDGLIVLILLWNGNATTKRSKDDISIPETYEKETMKYFRNSRVICVRASRFCSAGQSRNGIDAPRNRDTVNFWHNQKAIIIDSLPGNGSKLHVKHRKHKNAKIKGVTAFVGGLDITNGRYDDTDKSLFATLQSVHKDDFFQSAFPAISAKSGPRQPWQDAHVRVSGLAAVDILKNFIEHWQRQVGHHRRPGIFLFYGRQGKGYRLKRIFKLLKSSMAKSALPKSRIIDTSNAFWKKAETLITGNEYDSDSSDEEGSGIGGEDELDEFDRQEELRRNGGDTVSKPWSRDVCCQVVRSIDMHSALFPRKVTHPRLLSRSGVKIDQSLENAFVHHIRCAQHFVYIESQVFIGSSGWWNIERDTGATNVVPGELVAKICAKIGAGLPFHAYLCLSMYPEGEPSSPQVQQQLYWQYLTLEMMYMRIAQAIQRAGLQTNPTDYMSIYCLASREARELSKVQNPDPVANSLSPQAKNLYLKRRHPILINSNLLIVDDHVALVSSGSVNQRTLDGARDTALGVCVFDSSEKVTEYSTPKGEVYGHRMLVMAEHLGGASLSGGKYDEIVLSNPSSEVCVKHIQDAAQVNWQTFIAPGEAKNMEGHLMTYPIRVDKITGKVTTISPEFEYFVDCSRAARVLGTPSNLKAEYTM